MHVVLCILIIFREPMLLLLTSGVEYLIVCLEDGYNVMFTK